MANMNNVVIAGRLTKDPVQRSETNPVVNMVVAVNHRSKGRDGGEDKEHTDFVPVSVFGRTAEICAEKLHKGSSVLIEGRIRSRSKEINGERKFFTEVVARKIDFLDRYIKRQDEEEKVYESKEKTYKYNAANGEEEEVDFDDDANA
jgi:single-strand DNA-binding protein